MKNIVFALTALSLVAGSAPSLAAPCKDAKGKFVKCPVAKPKVCRNAQGHFIKCRGQAEAMPQRPGPFRDV